MKKMFFMRQTLEDKDRIALRLKSDFRDAMTPYEGRQATAENPRLHGRITMMTKQLDMAFSNDAVSKWHTQGFVKKLGLDKGEEQEERTTDA
jgi:hypothetical protein